jgi:cytochrome b561
MQLRNSPERYGAIPQALHWVVAGLVLAGWLLGTFGDALPRGPARAAGLFVHMSAGLAIVALVVVRVGWRIADPPPAPLGSRLGDWTRHAARITHAALYGLLIAVPLLGIVVQFGRGNPVPMFGWFEIASPWAADRAFARAMKGIHELLADTLVTVALLHAAAALAHHWLLRDRTLVRMLPGTK